MLLTPARSSSRGSLTFRDGQGVGAEGLQGSQVLAVLGAAALVLEPAAEEGAACCGRQALAGAVLVLGVGPPVSPVKLLVHPVGRGEGVTGLRGEPKEVKLKTG